MTPRFIRRFSATAAVTCLVIASHVLAAPPSTVDGTCTTPSSTNAIAEIGRVVDEAVGLPSRTPGKKVDLTYADRAWYSAMLPEVIKHGMNPYVWFAIHTIETGGVLDKDH